MQAIEGEDYDEAKRLKAGIDRLRAVGERWRAEGCLWSSFFCGTGPAACTCRPVVCCVPLLRHTSEFAHAYSSPPQPLRRHTTFRQDCQSCRGASSAPCHCHHPPAAAAGTKIAQLEGRKRAAVEVEDYDLAKELKQEVDRLR